MVKFRFGLFGLTMTSVLALTAFTANAADMYVPTGPGGYKDTYVPVDNWTGFYVGVNGGYGWSANDSKGTDTRPCTRQEFDAGLCARIGGPITDAAANRFGSSGGFGGGQIGYNFQPLTSGGFKDGPAVGRFVFGVEADLQGAAIDGSSTLNIPTVTGSATGRSDLDWFGTVRGRVGYAFDRTLIYATGGFAFGGVKDKLSLTAGGATSTVSASSTDTGFVVGGGIERFVSRAWSIKAEYQYIDLGSDKLSTTAGTASASLDAEHAYHTVRVGLNYHVLPAYEPLK